MNKQEEGLMYSTEETLTEIILILYQREIAPKLVGIITVAMEYEEQAKMYLQWLSENPNEKNPSKLVGKIIDLKIQLVGHQ
jgi:hypothetical protein